MRPVPYRLANGQREGRYLMFLKSGNVRVGLRPGCSGHGRIVLAATVCVFACFGCIEVWPPFAKMRTPLLTETTIDLSIGFCYGREMNRLRSSLLLLSYCPSSRL